MRFDSLFPNRSSPYPQPRVGAIRVLHGSTRGWRLVRNESLSRTQEKPGLRSESAGDVLELALPSDAPSLTLRCEFLTSYAHFGSVRAACVRSLAPHGTGECECAPRTVSAVAAEHVSVNRYFDLVMTSRGGGGCVVALTTLEPGQGYTLKAACAADGSCGNPRWVDVA